MSGTTAAVKAASRLRIFSAIDSAFEPATLRLVADGSDSTASFTTGSLRCTTEHEFSSPLRRAIADARLHLTRWQQPNGSFRGAQPADPGAVVQWILLAAWFEQLDTEETRQATRSLIDTQRPDGAWPRCHGGPADVSTTIVAYLALKLSGCTSREPVMQAARRYIWQQGGVAAADAPARMFLALFGQMPIPNCRITRPQSAAAGGAIQRAAFRLLKWLRPQSAAFRPGLVRELFKTAPDARGRFGTPAFVQRICSAGLQMAKTSWPLPHNKSMKRLANMARQRHTRRLRAQLVRRLRAARSTTEPSCAPSWDATVWASIALSCDADGSRRKRKTAPRRMRQRLVKPDQHSCCANLRDDAVADTALAVAALAHGGLTVRSATVHSAVNFLVQTSPKTIDESAWTLRALNAALSSDGKDARRLPPEVQICSNDTHQHDNGRPPAALLTSAHDLQQQLKTRLLESQLGDGGWTAIPPTGLPARWFAKSEVGLTALVLQALGSAGYQVGSPAVDRAIAFLKRVQRGDGRFADAAAASQPVSSSSSAVRTTANVLAALLCVGVPSRDATCQAASDWLVAHQQPEGGWGELPRHDPEYIPGEGPVCVEDTAAAVDSLVAAGLAGLEAVGSGVDMLLDADAPAGLRQRCSALLALCRWAADENNEERAVRHVPAPPLWVAELVDVPA